MRIAVRLLLWSVVALLTTMMPLRIFFADVKPIAWSEMTQSSVRLEVAFFLATVENIAAFCIAIALAAMFVLWVRSYPAVPSK
jgi:hypothetical protein